MSQGGTTRRMEAGRSCASGAAVAERGPDRKGKGRRAERARAEGGGPGNESGKGREGKDSKCKGVTHVVM